ncbi:MAG: M10 family metallopeptidase C-terminal domain-containing protein [Pseudomonadota bacterium]
MAVIEASGAEIAVDADLGDHVRLPDVTFLADGRFVVTWEDDSASIEGASAKRAIKAQLFTADGIKIDGQLQVNTTLDALDSSASVAALATGGFVVSWTNISGKSPGDGSSSSVGAQIFGADGSKIGGEFLVNTQTVRSQSAPDVAALSDGSFVVSWQDYSRTLGDSKLGSIKAQIFSPDGAKLGSEFLVNTATQNDQAAPKLTALAGGGFVATWYDNSGQGGDHFGTSIKSQIFSAGGAKVGSEILVNTFTDGNQLFPAIAALSNGNFVVSWDSNGIAFQLFDPLGEKIGTETRMVNAGHVAMFTGVVDAGGGDFVLTWKEADSDHSAVKAQLFDAAGTMSGAAFSVDSHASSQDRPSAAASADGHLVIAWTDETTTAGQVETSIKAQLYEVIKGITFTSDGGGQNVLLTTAEDSRAVTTVQASAEAGVVHYSLAGGDDDAYFEIDVDSGLLNFIDAPDFETPLDKGHDNVYNVIVRAATDGASGTQAISVKITDVASSGIGTTYIGSNQKNDMFIAPDGRDWNIFGLLGDDILTGGSGNDRMAGNGGKDLMTGGAGADMFVFEVDDSRAGGGLRDIVTDFQTGVDKLDLTALNISDFSEQVTFKTVGSGLIVYVDLNKNGFDYTDFGVQLTGVTTLQQNDFIL